MSYFDLRSTAILGDSLEELFHGVTIPNTICARKTTQFDELDIDKVIYNGPATIIKWLDGSETIVRKTEDDPMDFEKAFLMAYFQKKSGFSKTACGKFMDTIIETAIEQQTNANKKMLKKLDKKQK